VCAECGDRIESGGVVCTKCKCSMHLECSWEHDCVLCYACKRYVTDVEYCRVCKQYICTDCSKTHMHSLHEFIESMS
jgi:hypothetical protein